MKKLITIASVLLMAQAFAQEAPSFKVLERKAGSNKTIFKKVVLEDLESADSFEGRFFKIVKGKSNEAISFKDTDPSIVEKAATAYHHLTLAKKFWVDDVKSDVPLKLSQITVRLDISNLFDEQGHFANDKRNPQFNNAVSVPAGQTPTWVPADKKDKWEKEIWFRPMKKIDTSTLPNNLGPNPITTSLQTIEQPFLNFNQNYFNQALVEHAFYPTYASRTLGQDALIFAGTIAVTKAIIEASRLMDGMFIEKWYYLDTAMVPEVIYHEYAHVVLSDSLEMSHSTPVIEGMADYFAALQAKKRKIYAPVKGYSNSAAKDSQNKKSYTHWAESNSNATSDFVLAVLWDVRETLGAEAGDEVVYEARKSLKTGTATISSHLLQSILNACKTKCSKPRSDKFKLYEMFSKRGF